MEADDLPADAGEIEITGRLDRRTREVLRLEILRLARRHGLELGRFRIERPRDEA